LAIPPLVSTTTRFLFSSRLLPSHAHFCPSLLSFFHTSSFAVSRLPSSPLPAMSLTRTLAAALPDSISQPQLVRWVPGQTPLSTNTAVFSTIALYLVVIFGGQEMMKDRKPVRACAAAGFPVKRALTGQMSPCRAQAPVYASQYPTQRC
jgi:hypothetical protein